jgi:CelD/BcsL family acetyltransferase involved in cellulose biosynthesis
MIQTIAAPRRHLVGRPRRGTRYKALICRPRDLGSAEVQQWRAFQLGAGLESPYFSPDNALIMETLFPDRTRVAVVFDHAELVGFLPFTRHRFRRAVGLGDFLSGLQAFIPSRSPWSFPDVLRAARIDLYEFTNLIASQFPADLPMPQPHFLRTADLSHGFDDYLARVRQTGGKFVRTVEYKRRRMERNDPDLRFECGGHDLVAVRQLVAWKAAQVRRAGHWDLYTELPHAREWVERIAMADTPGMVGSVSCLRSGNRLVAGSINVRSATVQAGFLTAYDPDQASASPGLVCILKVLEAAARSGARSFHLGTGDQDFKRRLSTGAIELVEWRAGRPSIGTRASWSLIGAVGRLRQAASRGRSAFTG